MDGFWSNFAANLLATFFGILIGVPIALLIERSRARKEKESQRLKAEKDEESRQAETRAHTRKILELLKGELKENKNTIGKLHTDVSYYYEPIKLELWRAFSDGGELHWIKDPDLIDALAGSYAALNHVRILYAQYAEVFMYQGNAVNAQVRQPLFDQLYKKAEKCQENIDTTLQSIQNKLQALDDEVNSKISRQELTA